MAWSSRQVWGYTAVMLAIIVMSTIGTVTIILFLTTGDPPVGKLLIIESSTTTPSISEAPSVSSCQSTLQDAFVYLHDNCAIISSPSLNRSIQFLPYFNMRRCPNHRCRPNSCPTDRCCCQAIATSSLTYHCPNERGILVPNIVEKCGCAPCVGVPVVFVGTVTDTDNNAIAHATVSVENTATYHTNEEAIFGFSITSTHNTVVFMVTAVGYSEYDVTLPVMPGEVNVLHIKLMRQLSHTIQPLPHPLLVNLVTLALHPLSPSHNFSLPRQEDEDRGSVESFIEFPEGVLSEMATLIAQPVDLSSSLSLQSLGMSFMTQPSSDSIRRRRGVEWRSGEVGEEGEVVRKREGVQEEVVFVVSVGVLDVRGEEGERLQEGMSGLTVHVYILTTTHTCSNLIPFQFYLLTDMELRPVDDDITCSADSEQVHLSISLPPLTPLPITYLLGAPEEDVCYVAVRTFEPTSLGLVTEMVSNVWLRTRLSSGSLDMTNVMFGRTNECVSVPCRGEMSVRILDGLQYTPDSYTVLLDDDVIITSDDVVVEGEIYRDRSECEVRALRHEADELTYFKFVVLPRTPAITASPTPDDVTLTTPPFCSLRVGVALPVGVAEIHVSASSVSASGVRTVRVERVGSGGEGEEGGSGRCVECEENFISCVQVTCGHQVEVGVASVGGEMVCVPEVREGDRGPEGLVVEGGRVTLTEGAGVNGLVTDFYGPDPSVAMEMCNLGTDTDVRFHCIKLRI